MLTGAVAAAEKCRDHGVCGHEQEEEQVMRLRSGQSLRSSVQPLDVPVAIFRMSLGGRPVTSYNLRWRLGSRSRRL